MTTSVSKDSIVDIFKKVYGKANDLRPGPDIVDDLMPFEEGQLVGDQYVEDFILGDEVGITWAGTAQDAFSINPAIAGGVKQSTIQPSQTVMSSVLSWAFMSRSAGGSEQAFFDGTKHVMRNHLQSHNKLISIAKLYGQATSGLGYVSYAASGTVYRGASYTGSGNITLTKKDGTTIAFTAGINAASKAILFAPGEFAAGFWVGKKGIRVNQIVKATGAVAASGSVTGWDARLGILYVDFTPVAATSTTSHYMCYADWEANKVMVGANKILTNTSSLFGINAASEPLWSGNSVPLGGKKFNLKAVHDGVSDAINAGGLEEPLDIIVNPYTFGRMANDEAAFRKYDASYKPKAENGFEAIEYYAANGVNRIHSSSKVKEGEAYGLVRGHWRCSGSQLPSFRVRGMNQEVIFPLQDQAGFVVRSFADEYVMCRQPAKNILWTGLNHEGVDY